MQYVGRNGGETDELNISGEKHYGKVPVLQDVSHGVGTEIKMDSINSYDGFGIWATRPITSDITVLTR